MSASGPAIFDDDLACDVRDEYRKLLEERVPDDEATRHSIEDWQRLGPDEEPVFWLALAATQSLLGRLEEHVRERALEVIDSGRDLVRWREAGAEFAADRAAVLADLRERLTGPQPSRKTVRRPWREVTDLQPGTVLSWTGSTGAIALLRVVQRQEDAFDHTVRPVLERLAWTGRDMPPAEVLAELPAATDFETRRRAAVGGRPVPGIFIAFRLKRRDPDWADLGFTVCGQIPARSGDDGDWRLHIVHVQWLGLPFHLEREMAEPSPGQGLPRNP